MTTETSVQPSRLIRDFARELSIEEKDALKYELSLAAIREMDDDFSVSNQPANRQKFDTLLQGILDVYPFQDRVPPYGIAYKERPSFLDEALLAVLVQEADKYRAEARINYDQYLSQVDTPEGQTIVEQLEASEEVLQLVKEHAGNCLPSFVSSFIYYDEPGLCSRPHVDNAFTGITLMIGLKHTSKTHKHSESIVYWPGKEPCRYQLLPGEAAIFYGVGVLHGRTPVVEGEEVVSLLMSFRPVP